ncbi:MAG TPA: response regulator [Steroidobacteraceae bacterium]
MSGPHGRVYLVDDDPRLRESIARWLTDAGCRVRTFPSGESLLGTQPHLLPGCIIADMLMPGMSGLELQRRLEAAGCHWPFIMLTGHGSPPVVARAVEAGVIAFLEKPVREIELLAAIMQGQAHLLGKAEIIPGPDLLRRVSRLTRRERQVVELVLRQKRNKQIAAILGISETTIKGYRRTLMKKLGAHSTLELVVLAIRAGLYNASQAPKP